MIELIQRILDYNFETEELDEVGEMTSAEELFAVLNHLLQSNDPDQVSITLGFIRDFMIMSRSPERKEISDRYYPESSLVKTIEQLLFYPNHATRLNAVYTLGKTCSYSSVNIITQAFDHFRDRDPILLPRLLGELGWLGGESFDDCVMSKAESPLYITRWASIPMLSQFGDLHNDIMYQRKLARFQQFRDDENRLIREEAEYAYQEQVSSRELWIKNQDLRRKQREIVRQKKVGNQMKRLHQERKRLHQQQWQGLAQEYEPAISFDSIANSFQNYLRCIKKVDYTIDELEAFIPHYVTFREELRLINKDYPTWEELDIFMTTYKHLSS